MVVPDFDTPPESPVKTPSCRSATSCWGRCDNGDANMVIITASKEGCQGDKAYTLVGRVDFGHHESWTTHLVRIERFVIFMHHLLHFDHCQICDS